MSFVSAGVRKTAAEEKQQQQEGGSDDSDDDSPPAPPPPRATAPKKLQMVNLFMSAFCPFANHSFKENIGKSSKTFF